MITLPRQNSDHRDAGGFCTCCGMVWPCARVRKAEARRTREPVAILPRQLAKR
jgi:hypothetical protein